MMKSIAVMLLAALSFGATASDYDVSVTRKGSNLYTVEGKNIMIHTRYCYEYAYSEQSLLRMNWYDGEIIFLDSGGKCDVKAVYGETEQSAGNYSVEISHVSDDWYEVWGTGVFIKTSGCLSLALTEEAVLALNSGSYGTLHVGSERCTVEGLYSKMKL